MAADKFDESAHGLAYKGDYECLKVRVNQDKTRIRQLDDNKRMPIHWAALGGHVDIVSYLLDQQSPVDPLDDMEMSPLILSSSAGKDETVHLLISHGANVNHKNKEGHSSLQYAASKGWLEVLKMLLQNGADINVADRRGATPLHRASSVGHVAVVKHLLECGHRITPDARDAYGNTPLHLACEEDRTEVARLLVMNGSSLEVQNKEEKTPLEMARPGLARELLALKEQ